ncbi:DUF4091 domain-containing protein [Paenibacillus sp. YN15]|uniref:DUF4091 domain-containing protein n=1 Tax=Paenibacillus sp. YN15 TaxID=1742774 RepID=UPI000DCBF228|nr:DUF4091 domain-containing protein [Paenibacillus sp. YN15]RAU93884.1 hypothetical protein DQG13_24955 [Paenibacillus sp. YN15]
MTSDANRFETRCISSLPKVFPDVELDASAYSAGSALLNERFSFQIAFRSGQRIRDIKVEVESGLKEAIRVQRIGLVPSEYPVRDTSDDYVLRRTPGLYPDPLYGLASGEPITALGGQWHSLRIEVDPDCRYAPGSYPITIRLSSPEKGILGEETLNLQLLPATLPGQRLLRTEWFHADCIATHYRQEIFSEEHWKLMEAFIRTAVRNGVNTLLTPLFTPPLDTKVGGERPTAQLVDVYASAGRYSFGFAKLERWVALCRKCGITHFEFSHLFTQWGAQHAPKIMADTKEGTVRLFGWDTDAAGSEYRSFLKQFLPQLRLFIEDHQLGSNCFFHVSDEPHLEHLESYREAVKGISGHVDAYPRIDALSDYAFYESGLVPVPVPATNHVQPFLDAEVPGLWVYYCNSQDRDVSNRFMAHPLARTRIIGMQLYKYKISGFLHWGYNFWYSQYSIRQLNPFQVTDCDHAFPSGDAFVVYPGPDGPIESIRLAAFHEGLQDLRALECLEALIGREHVLAMLEEGLDTQLTFSSYPREDSWLLEKREAVNRLIRRHLRHREEGAVHERP